jgi:hypothetical protein
MAGTSPAMTNCRFDFSAHSLRAILYLPGNRFRAPHKKDWRTADKRPISQREEKSDAEHQ